jgi:hypothetical protein
MNYGLFLHRVILNDIQTITILSHSRSDLLFIVIGTVFCGELVTVHGRSGMASPFQMGHRLRKNTAKTTICRTKGKIDV